jgi:hypothetical protein
MDMSEEIVEIRVRLPKVLVDWLSEYCALTKVKPDDYIGALLRSHYDVWRMCEAKYKLQLANLADRLRSLRKALEEAVPKE